MNSPYGKAIRHAKECARLGKGVESCGYKQSNWRAVWLKAFEEAQQLKLNLNDTSQKENTNEL
jgi:ribosome modulation factor